LKARIPEIDVFRGIAVLLVIYLHVEYFSDWYAPVLPLFLRRVVAHTARDGWIGVDLFFVLSGYLIAGLLFSEYLKSGRISFGRFFIRRGLKIWPAFYAMITVTICTELALRIPFEPRRVIAEILYVQNYSPGLWGHTWSLGVEEYFYIILPLLLICLVAMNPSAPNPFRRMPALCITLFALALVLRAIYLSNGVTPEKHWTVGRESHFRFDALLFGVLLYYLSLFRGDRLNRALKAWPQMQVAVAAILIAIPLCFNILTSFLANTIGYTFVYLGCGLLLIQALAWRSSLKKGVLMCLSPIGRIGEYSYSIYLWHLPVREVAKAVAQSISVSVGVRATVAVAVYILGSLGGGILMSKLVEMPVLKMADKVFPSRSGNIMPP
jgi:peptidoglycan/LPS O-acetylase OafA/YrhL